MNMDDITAIEWKDIILLVDFLEPFFQATKDLEGSSYPTLSLAYPIIYVLMKKTLHFNTNGIHINKM